MTDLTDQQIEADLTLIEDAASDLLGMCSDTGYQKCVSILASRAPALVKRYRSLLARAQKAEAENGRRAEALVDQILRSDALAARLALAEAKLRAVEKLHREASPTPNGVRVRLCLDDGERWPCRTARALAADTTPEQEAGENDE